MKKMRRLIPAIAMLLVSAVMLSTASFAWFTISTSATATGMSVTATASSSLLITDATDKFLSATGTVDASKQLEGQNIDALVPATHAEGFANNLKAVEDAAAVNPSTGAYEGTYKDSVKNTNFVEYTLYLGTTGTPLENQFLNAEVTIANDLEYKLHNAVTVDFYVNGNYGGKINLEQVAATKSYNIDIAKALTIPAAVEIAEDTGAAAFTDEYVTVVMRVYFDGALEDASTSTTGDCYVRNQMSTTTGVGFTVKFGAKGAASANQNADIYDATPADPGV